MFRFSYCHHWLSIEFSHCCFLMNTLFITNYWHLELISDETLLGYIVIHKHTRKEIRISFIFKPISLPITLRNDGRWQPSISDLMRYKLKYMEYLNLLRNPQLSIAIFLKKMLHYYFKGLILFGSPSKILLWKITLGIKKYISVPNLPSLIPLNLSAPSFLHSLFLPP